jgi:toxin ParE1/3/4
MGSYYLTKRAVQDLAEIWNYTLEQWSEEQANKYYRMLLNRCDEICKSPDLGKRYEEIADKLLGLSANRHIIFYRIMDQDRIEITRILHQSMDLKSRLSD